MSRLNHDDALKKFNSNYNVIDRDILIEVLKDLNITHKDDIYYIKDNKMIRSSGHNKIVKIIDISDILTKGRLNKLIDDARLLSYYHYVLNPNGVTFVKNKDTGVILEIGKYGLDKSFRGNVIYEKLATCNKLSILLAESIYFGSTFRKGKKDIICHNFIVPVIVLGNRKAFVRMVVKEYKKDPKYNIKFYYHEINYLNNKKEDTFT